MRLEARARAPLWLMIAAPVGAVAAALIICSALILWTGAPLFEAYALLLKGAFGSRFAITETLTRATPLILTGLAVAIAFRAKLWNIGAEGQFYLGALAAVAVGSGVMSLPAPLMIPLVMVVSMIAGGLLLLGPAFLKTKLGVDEVVTTLLLNFIVLLFVSMMLEGPMKDPLAMGWPQSPALIADARLPRLLPKSRLHLGLIIALAFAVLIWVMKTRTVWGFEIRSVGSNPRAAAFAGVPVNWVVLRVALLSGGLAGLAGAVEVMGRTGYLTLDISPGYGYSGIVVAMLAQLNPLGVVAAALMVAGVFVGADAMSRGVAVPTYISDVIVATSLLCMLTAMLLVRYRLRWR